MYFSSKVFVPCNNLLNCLTSTIKEIPLSEILAVKTVSSDDEKATHCFEVQTARTTYFVGEKKEVTMATLTVDGEESPTESGIGTEVAKIWEKKIRQALMPVTPQQSTTSVTSSSSPSKSHSPYLIALTKVSTMQAKLLSKANGVNA